MSKIISIVVPTYNMEKYLANCLDSFIYDEKNEDIEVLIVNDGSKDNSLNIAKEYEKKYPKIFKVIDKENGGHGSTINAGLKVAKGKYFKVVDADDWVDTKNFETFVNKLRDCDVDCVVANYSCFYELSHKKKLIQVRDAGEGEILDLQNVDDFKFCIHTFAFKTSKIKGIKIQEHCFYVDVEYNLYSYLNCDNMVYFDLDLYQYRLGRVGQSVSANGLYKHRDNHLLVIKNVINYYYKEQKNVNDKKKELAFNYICDVINSHYKYYQIFYKLHKDSVSEIKEFDAWLKSAYEEIYAKTNSYKHIASMRKKDFANIGGYNFIYRCKQFAKKLLGRA